MHPAADRIVLIPAVGPEILAALLVLAIAIAGIGIAVIMFRRGRVEALSLIGVFGLLLIAALLALFHVPTRLAIDRDGIDLTWWLVHEHRSWRDVAAVEVTRGRFGLWLRLVEPTDGASTLSFLWPPRAGFFVGALPIEPHELVMRIDAWRLAGSR